MDKTVFRWALPDLGEGVHEGEVVRWHVAEGDRVAVDQVLAEIQTDKALVEIPSPVAGRVLRLLAPPGAVVPVGTVLLEVETDAAAAPGGDGPAKGSEPAQGSIPGTGGVPVTGVATGAEAGAERAGLAADTVAETAGRSQGTGVAGAGPGGRRRALAAPAVRRRARQLGIDIDTIAGTGPGGRVTMADVERAARGTEDAGAAGGSGKAPGITPDLQRVGEPKGRVGAPAAGATAAGPDDERVPMAGLRRVIAERMVRSLQTTAQVTGMDEADVTELVALRGRAAAEAEGLGVKLTYLPFIIKAVISGLRAYPYVNAEVDDTRGEIVLRRRYHIGIAVDTPDGLVVPVIHDADRLNLLQLAQAIEDLSRRARERKLTVAEMQGGTFTISNIGSFGGTFATPILNPPQVAILATGRIVRRPMFDAQDRVVPRHLMAVSLTFDHRVLDGADATRFMRHVVERLERPERLVLEL
ncbi:dihydrolipoamide acetyltransferase family protein [Alicyclobacillus sp.]|uniref:dihydrolipoamide acetyltransferase family protein n=1 Tax=Alicyclobacillus sp. TaxID=61169 RepID=UPI0025BE77F0|nr:dihydrolipoamide acetyltransferase family protein [Alicyclobacillus sp.]MCL6516377.1 2-oxo acid dehydrogenase subunit E2 [Alicyclobacillus sp.]